MLKLAESNIARKLGIKVENTIQEFLQMFQYKSYSENDLSKNHDKYINGICSRQLYGIDHLIILPNKVICIQDKWKKQTICKDAISNFVSAILACKKMFPKLEIVCVFISKSKISETAKDTLLLNNKTCYFIELLEFNELFRLLKYIMHLHDNFMIDDDGTTIMFDNYDCEEIILCQSNKITL